MPDDGLCELKHVAQCYVTLQCVMDGVFRVFVV